LHHHQPRIQSQHSDDAVLSNPVIYERPERKYRSEIFNAKDFSEFKQPALRQWNNFQPKKDAKNETPIVILPIEEEKHNPPQQCHHQEIYKLHTYSQVKLVLLLGDKLLTLEDKDVIRVWDIAIRFEIGQFRDLVGLKNIKITHLLEWKYPNEFDFDDKAEHTYSPHENEQRCMTLSSDNILRIFNLHSMKLERSIKFDMKYVTAFSFVQDKSLFCIGGRYESEFSVLSLSIKKPRLRYIKFFSLSTLQEFMAVKLPSEPEDVLTSLEYADK
jgi:hypothetical protein